MDQIEKFLIPSNARIADAISKIDLNGEGIVLVVDQDRRLIGTVTDGDIRRAMLRHVDVSESVVRLLERSPDSPHQKPLVAHANTSNERLLELLEKHRLRHIPLHDDNHKIVGLINPYHLTKDLERTANAVIMAGGYGHRLRPLTETVPKPMLPVGDKPLMERLLNQIESSGIRQVYITTHYLQEKIRSHFGSGQKFGVTLDYVSEDQPLGTAGALRLLEKQDLPLLVINGDILTNVDFRHMMRFHEESKASLSIGVCGYEIIIPYGVVDIEQSRVCGIIEKPKFKHFINAGIYILEPHVIDMIPAGRKFDMTDLLTLLIAEGEPVASFPIREYWLDIGRQDDYVRAQKDVSGEAFKK